MWLKVGRGEYGLLHPAARDLALVSAGPTLSPTSSSHHFVAEASRHQDFEIVHGLTSHLWPDYFPFATMSFATMSFATCLLVDSDMFVQQLLQSTTAAFFWIYGSLSVRIDVPKLGASTGHRLVRVELFLQRSSFISAAYYQEKRTALCNERGCV